MNKKIRLLTIIAVLTLPLAAGAVPNAKLADQCEDGLNVAYKELNFAKSQGFGGKVAYTKAASLLSAAKIQQQFDKYPNCIEKVGRAREYIRQSKR